MNRRYSIEEFEKSTELLREAYKNVSLTTDIIVGFPGENDEEFNKTYNFLQKIKFYKMHIFKYSQRKGTIASKMQNQVNGEIKEERSKKLIELSNKNEREYNNQYKDKQIEVLFEESHIENGKRYMKGHTTNYMVVNVQTNENLENKIKNVKIIKTDGLELIGELL